MPKGSKRKKPVTPTVPRASKAPAGTSKTASVAAGMPPWTPMAIFAWTLVTGPLYGGIFAAINARRLGLKEIFGPTVLMALVAQAALPVARQVYPAMPYDSLAALNVILIARVLAAYFYLFTQRETYWDHEDAGGRKESTLWPSLIALALAVIQARFRGYW